MAIKQQTSNYAAQSAFVFSGKVIKLKAATVEGIKTDNTAVVQIDHVVTAPAMFTALSGQQITVRFKSLAGLKKGSSMTFFTNGWMFGASVAVDAVGFVKETEKHAMASTVKSAATSGQDNVLNARLDSAGLVVVGKVTKVEQSAKATTVEPRAMRATAEQSAKGTTHISEHDPNWHEATIDVDEVVKGSKNTKQVTVLFPKSDDIRWYKIAKYQEGQQGIWLLQKGKKQAPEGLSPKVFTAIPAGSDVMTSLHSADFLPLNELGRVKSLLRK
jgi:hypothetical protein